MDPERVLACWIGPLDDQGLADKLHEQRWFTKDEAFDQQLREQFEPTWHAVMRGDHPGWLDTARGRLAYVVLLDQLSRNMFRGSRNAFAGDARALQMAAESVARGDDGKLIGHERLFLYMPFMHCEELRMQERCVSLFRGFRDEVQGPLRERLENNLAFAIAHRDVIAKWGRFPHRNTVLDRTSTAAEMEFLKEPGFSF